MSTTYNEIAGRSVERLAALSDGVFAVAMTLLVLDLRSPAAEAVHSERGLWLALVALAPRLAVYMMTFMTLGIFWVGQQSQLNHLARSDRSLSWIHIVFLFAVSMTPFSTSLLAGFTTYRTALLVYWANILLLGATLYFSWVCATGTGLVKDDLPAALRQGHPAPHRRRASAVRVRRSAVRHQHVLEHRLHRSGAVELRRGAADSAPSQELEMTRPALVVIDVQKAIDRESWARYGGRNNPQAERNIARLLARWRKGAFPIYHVRHDSREPQSAYRPGQPGNEFKPEALPLPGETVVAKQTNSAFIGTGFEEMLRGAGHSVLAIAGVITNNSVEATVRMAGNLGFETYLVEDACFTYARPDWTGRARTAEEVHAMSLANLDGEYCTVVTTEEALARWQV